MARYRDAIEWIVRNDDVSDIGEADDPLPTVTMALTADLFGKDDETVFRDITREIARLQTRKETNR